MDYVILVESLKPKSFLMMVLVLVEVVVVLEEVILSSGHGKVV